MWLRPFKITSLTIACILLFISNSYAQDELDDKHIEVSLRMIGHQVLLNSDDSTSRVLPIIKENSQYRIQFESEFGFNPDDLVNTVNRIIKDTKMSDGYILEVEQCESGEVVYSYEMGDLENIDIIPCRARDQPKSCYSLLFTLTESKEATLNTTSDSSKEPSTETSGVNYFIVVLVLALLVLVFFILWRKRDKSIIDPNLIALGKYRFDQRNSELIIAEQRIELTSKEADLLLLLYKTVNKTVEREVILNVVWGDEGDYVGRTLDVFISKLRKKLEADSSVKIVNIRGVGYKLVLDI